MKCEVCQKSTKEFLIYEVITRKILRVDHQDVKKKALCHEHLIDEFTRRFIGFPYKLVIFYPELEPKKRSFAYAFLPLAKLREFGKDITAMDKGLSELAEGCCKRCGQPAQVVYFDRHTLPRDKAGEVQVIKWNKSLGDQLQGEAEILCLKCAAGEILPSLREYDKFNGGLCAPYNGDGVFVTLMV
jgi:hypothetical protein